MELIEPVLTAGPDDQINAAPKMLRSWGRGARQVDAIGPPPMVRRAPVVNIKRCKVSTTLGGDWPLRSQVNARPEQLFSTR